MNLVKPLIAASFMIILIILLYVMEFDIHVLAQSLRAQVDQNAVLAATVFFFAYLGLATFNLPGSGALTLTAGVVFGFTMGLLLVSFSSTIGATFSMLLARTLLRDWVERRFTSFSVSVNKGIERHGASYLFSLRMLPIAPFFVINPVFGLTSMPVWKFYIVSQLGMLPLTAIYVNLGATVGDLEHITFWGVFTPELMIALSLLMLFPFSLKVLRAHMGSKEPKLNG